MASRFSARDVVYTALNAALYVVVGYLTYLGIFAPVVGVVRFWPSVLIPTFFAVVAGPIVGGVGAAIGIFISDMLIHGNALLSVTVGVPANFICFYTIGVLARKLRSVTEATVLILVPNAAAVAIALVAFCAGWLDALTTYIYVAAVIVSVAIPLAAMFLWRFDLARYFAAGSVGLMLGSAYIGVGVWAFSQFFMLPNGQMNLPLTAAVLWYLWTYISEIPFVLLGVAIADTYRRRLALAESRR